MPKIAIDARTLPSTSGRYLRGLLKYLQEIDDVNQYYILLRDLGDWKPVKKNFKTVHAPFADFSFAEQLKLLGLLRKLKPDLVHFGMPQYPILYFGKRINTIHDLTILKFSHPHWNPVVDFIKRIVFRFVMMLAVRGNKTITPSRYTKTEIVRRFRVDPMNIKVTHEAAEKLTVTPKEYRPMKNKEFIFYVGNVFPYKNIERLIKAFDIIKAKHPDLHLLIVGKEKRYHAELKKLVKYEGIKNVVFTGFMPDAQLAWLYQNAQAYIFPSLSEGFGLPGLEALNYDCPLISSNSTSLPEVYGEAAEYFDPTSIEDMAQAVNRVLSDRNLKKKIIMNGRKQRDLYSWKKMAEQTLEIYKQVLKK